MIKMMVITTMMGTTTRAYSLVHLRVFERDAVVMDLHAGSHWSDLEGHPDSSVVGVPQEIVELVDVDGTSFVVDKVKEIATSGRCLAPGGLSSGAPAVNGLAGTGGGGLGGGGGASLRGIGVAQGRRGGSACRRWT